MSEPSMRRARVTWAHTIEPEPVVWAWIDGDHKRIPAGSLSVAAGREATGKSSFGIWLCAQITTGQLPGTLHGQARRVLYVAIEDSWKYTLVPRLIASDADLGMVGRFEVVTTADEELTISLPEDLSLLEQTIREHQVALVVVDPLLSVIGASIDTHRNREVRSALDPLAQIAERTGAVVLGIAHFNKGNGSDPASLITGSGAFKDVPRSVFGFARDDEDATGRRVITQVKNSLGRDDLPSLAYTIESVEIDTRLGPAETGRFVMLGESERSVADIIRESHIGDGDRDERNEIDGWLSELLESEGGSSPAKEVITAGRSAGFKEDAIKKARRRIKARSERHGFGKGSSVVWSIDAPIGAIGASKPGPASIAPMTAPMESEATEESAEGTEESRDRRANPSVPSAAGATLVSVPTSGELSTTGCGHPSHKTAKCPLCLADRGAVA